MKVGLISESLFTFCASLTYTFHSLIKPLKLLLLNAYWKTITIPVIPENLSPIYQLFLEKFSSKNSKVYKKYNLWSHYCFFHPVISQFLIAAISFVTDCKELKIAQTCQNSQLFQLLHLICTYDDAFYGLTGVLMNKNLNNDVNKDSPIRALMYQTDMQRLLSHV